MQTLKQKYLDYLVIGKMILNCYIATNLTWKTQNKELFVRKAVNRINYVCQNNLK